ncbi:MAG: GYF domain-containing protein, partial [Planctomycetaceae bacterium]
MAVNIQHDRWSVSAADFAVRVIVPDLKGFFDNLPLIKGGPKARSLVIEPGTRALVIDEGMLVGEVPAGSYTLESFVQRLQFWRNKQTTVFLVRAEDVPLSSTFKNVPCLESVCFDLSCQWTVQINNILEFMDNLMGARESLSIAELLSLLTPMVQQAVYATVGRHSFDDVHSPTLVGFLNDGLRAEIDVKFQRYGLDFVDLQTVQATCDDGGLQERKGDMWLASRETQLQRAASEVENDQLSAQLHDIRGKVPLRKQLRDAVSSDKLNNLQSSEDFADALLEIDKGKLLRKEERDSLIAAFEARKDDRENLREHLLATIDLQREQELDELRVELDHAVRHKSLEKEIELARLSQTKEAQEWRHELEREKEQATHRRQQKADSVKARWERVREVRQEKRDDSWETILHDQKMEEVRADLEVAKADRARKVALIQSELKSRLESDKLEVQNRQQEWELEFQDKKSTSKIDKLQRVQDMNAQLAERQQKMQVEMENLKADSASKRELERINAMSNLSTEALVATANADNAALLADLKKHEATQDAVKVQASANPSAELNKERLRMYEKMNETERSKADAIAEAYKTAMLAQQGDVGQMIGGLAQAATPSAPAGSPPLASATETWHVSLNGQQSPPLQFGQVQHYIQTGQVNASTMVWKTGMADWMSANQVPELATLLTPSGGPSPMPDPGAPPG